MKVLNKISFIGFILLFSQNVWGQFAMNCKPFPDPKEIIDVAMDGENNHLFTWFVNGKVAEGKIGHVDCFKHQISYSMPASSPSKTPSDIVAIAMDGQNNHVFYWYRDYTYSVGSPDDLDKYKALTRYSLPSGYTPNDIVGIGFDDDMDRAGVLFRDGKTCGGSPGDLDNFRAVSVHNYPASYSAKQVVGLATDGMIQGGTYDKKDLHYVFFDDGTYGRVFKGNFLDLNNYIRYYIPQAPSAQRTMPKTVEIANQEFPSRKLELINSWVKYMMYPQRRQDVFPKWKTKGNAQHALTMIASTLYMLGRPSEFQLPRHRQTINELDQFVKKQFGSPNTASNLGYFQRAVEQYFNTIHPFAEVGTSREYYSTSTGDYDMTLFYLADFLYTFKDMKAENGTDLLTNEMIYQAISHTAKENGKVLSPPLISNYSEADVAPFTFNPKYYQSKLGGVTYGVYIDKGFKKLVTKRWYNTETENHVLMEYTWNYLMSNWIMWQGSLPSSNPRYDARVKDILLKKNVFIFLKSDYNSWWLDRMLQIVGRTVHNGLFETNAKPYQSFYLAALITLAEHADNPTVVPFSDRSSPIIPVNTVFPNFKDDQKRVALGAKNAFYYIAAKFAFQSFEGKRSAPMRRETDRAKAAGFYQHDAVSRILGVLSGGYICSECQYYYKDIYHTGLDPFWTALTDTKQPKLQIPYAIHDFMLNKHGGYYARMMDNYSRDVYSIGFLDPDRISSPRYFKSDGKPFRDGSFKGSPEVYFCTDEYMLSAGGMYKRYFNESAVVPGDLKDLLRVYHFWAKPTMLITKGDIGGKYWASGDKDNSIDLNEAQNEVMMLLGNSGDFSQSNNLWVYKNFVYGYEHKKDGGTGYFRGWPQRYPAEWDKHLYVPRGASSPVIQIGTRAAIKIFDFTKDNF
ncbi:MAG: hypothetical protein IPI11_02100 [Haliscomenobacter sp.]|nr:hypothetical protein [Haliscomenobacter sp.]